MITSIWCWHQGIFENKLITTHYTIHNMGKHTHTHTHILTNSLNMCIVYFFPSVPTNIDRSANVSKTLVSSIDKFKSDFSIIWNITSKQAEREREREMTFIASLCILLRVKVKYSSRNCHVACESVFDWMGCWGLISEIRDGIGNPSSPLILINNWSAGLICSIYDFSNNHWNWVT